MAELISIYIHIPFCLSKCAYCDFFSVPQNIDKCKSDSVKYVDQKYVDALTVEIEAGLKAYNFDNTVMCKSVYIGGGTPSLLSLDQIKTIITTIKNNVKFCSDYEFTAEVNPDDVTVDFIQGLNKTEINRISCGFQSFNPQVLRKINRRAGLTENLQALNILKTYWKGTFSADLISGLPYETNESFFSGLQTLINAKPDHISLYALTIEEETSLGKQILNEEISYDYDLADNMWLEGRMFLQEHDYTQYEVSNFCKSNKYSKHNLTYWNHENYLGFGCGATGSIHLDDGSIFRYSNKNNINEYVMFWLNKKNNNENFLNDSFIELYKKIDDKVCEIEKVSSNVAEFEFFMMGFRKLDGIKEENFEKIFNKKIPEEILSVFYKWNSNLLMDIEEYTNSFKVKKRVFRLNNQGILYLNKLLEEI